MYEQADGGWGVYICLILEFAMYTGYNIIVIDGY